MRKGQNPAKYGFPAYRPQQIGIAVLVYIPETEGYFRECLQVLKIQIASLRQNTSQPFDLWIFDNGSCPEVLAELQNLHARGWIDGILLSRHNVGKTGALNWILGAMPNEVIGYADSDVFFRPGWLEHSLEIMKSFPNPGLITAQPSLFDVLRGEGRASAALSQMDHITLKEQCLDAGVVEEYCRSINLTSERCGTLQNTPFTVASNQQNGVQALVAANHMQFLITRDLARRLLPLPASYALSRDEDYILNQRVDQAGYLHLSTLKPYVYHMGNELDESILVEIEGLDTGLAKPVLPQVEREHPGWFNIMDKLSRIGFFSRLFRRAYNLLFKYYARS